MIGTLILTTFRQLSPFELKQASLMSFISTQPLARKLKNCCLNLAPVMFVLLTPICFECGICDCRSSRELYVLNYDLTDSLEGS